MNNLSQLLKTDKSWSDLLLPDQTMRELNALKGLIKSSSIHETERGIAKKLNQGLRALFYGSTGTDKTLTASLLGKLTGKDVYKIDLALVISKYIGETEKNLGRLFAEAENKDWILFFDEADALFGKRTNVRDAHDRYANQVVSFLMQRIEEYSGLIILSTNNKRDIPNEFIRRFEACIYFPRP